MKKGLKIGLFSVLGAVGLVVLLVAGYILYVAVQYYRVEDNFVLDIASNKQQQMQTDVTYSAITYNIGFGAYSPQYSFFMDTGETKAGKTLKGKYGKGLSAADVQKNTDGSVALLKAQNADIALVQEVDVKSDRAYKINQLDALSSLEMGYTFAQNFDSAFLAYPFTDAHGKTKAGLVTMSKYKIDHAVRRSFTIDNSFPTRFLDLDRCFSIQRLPIDGGKSLSLFNIHMSAYDKGGIIRAAQLVELNAALAAERAVGNYVVAGGDFNHDIAQSMNVYPTTQKIPTYVYELNDTHLAENFKFAAPTNAATSRNACAPYVAGESYTLVLDGFIVSDNVQVVAVETLDNSFEFSDHNAVKLQFILKN